MGRRVSPVLLGFLALVSSAGAANAVVLWEGDFEKNDLSQWDSTNLIMTGDRLNLVLQGEKVAEGAIAAEITLREDVIFEPYNQSRVEVKHNGLHTQNGEDSYFAWSFMVPGDAEIRSNIGYWESLVSFQNTMTFYIEPGDVGTDVVFGTGNLGQDVQWSTPLELNVWHRLAIHNHWSQDQADGRVNVWYDGVQVVTDAVATKYNADPLFFQMGLHRSDPAPPVQVIYIDAAIEADTLDDILEPLPVPMGGSGGMGGTAGMGGGGAGAGGTISSGGSAGSVPGGSAGMPSGGAPVAGAGTGGASGGQTATPSPSPRPQSAATDSGSCAIGKPSAAGANALALLLALGWLGRRRISRPGAEARCAPPENEC